MKKGYINWKLVLVLVLCIGAIGATVVGLRKFNRTQRAEQGLKKGLAAYEEELWQEAASNLGHYLAVHQTDTEVLLKYGHAQAHIQPFKRENYAQAINAYRSVLRNDETNLQAAQSLIDLYLQAQIPGEAELVATRFLEKKQDVQITRRLATAQVMQRKYEQAVELLTDIVVRQPEEITSYELLAHIAQERPELLKKSDQEWIDAAVEKNPENAQAYILRSGFLSRKGLREQAVQDLEQASRCDLSEVNTRLALAAAWLRLEAIEQAESQLNAVFAENPALPELWQLRALIAIKRQDSAMAAQVARQGLEQLGQNKTVFLPYAVELFLQTKDLQGARSAIEEFRKTELNRGLVCYLDGLMAERDGDWPKALSFWREAVMQGYTTESVYLKLAEGAVRMEDRTTAIETLRRYVTTNNRSFSAQLMLARILMESRQWKEASDYASAAARLNPQSKETQNTLSRCRIELLAAQPQSKDRVDQMLTELIAADDSLDNRLLAFRIALNRQDWQKAQNDLERLKQQHGNELKVCMAEAEYLARKNQTDLAASILDEAIVRFPEASEPVILRAAIYSDREDALNALKLLQDAVSRMKDQDLRKVQLWMADLYRKMGQTRDLIELFTKLAAQNPHDILARRQLLALSRDTADPQQLQKWIEEIKQIEGGQAGRLWKIEQALLWMTQSDFAAKYPQTVSLLNENLKANPDDKQSLMVLASAHEMGGNKQLAVSLYRDTLTRYSGDIDLAIAAMGAMYRAEEYRQAEQLLNELLAAGHSDPRLAQLELQSHLRQGRLDTAESLLEKMVARNARDISAKMSLAMLKTRNAQFNAAKQLIDEIIVENPDAVAPHAVLADWHLRQEQKQQALAVCESYLAQHDTVDAYRFRCQVFLAMNEKDKAVKDIETILQRADNSAEIYLNVSELCLSAGLQAQALETAQKALTIKPDLFDAQKQVAILLLADQKSRRQGMELLEKALVQQPRDVQLRLLKASLLLEQGAGPNAAQGLEILNTLVSEFPRLESAWGYLVEWYMLTNQSGMAMDTVLRGLSALPENRALLFSKARIEALHSPAVALETLNQLARKYPADDAVIEMQARQMHRVGKSEQAVAILRQRLAAASAADTIRWQFPLMEILFESGSAGQAEEIYRQLVQNQDTSAAAMIRWLRLIGKTAKSDELLSEFQQWYDLNPQKGAAALPVLQNLLEAKNPEAVAAAEQILKLVQTREPENPDAAYGVAMLRHMTGQKIEAIPLYERALELQPENVIAMNNLAWILSQEKGEHNKALALADKGISLSPKYTDLIDTRGTIYMSMGQYEKAALDFKQAAERYLDTQTEKTSSTFNLAKCYRQLGRIDLSLIESYKARDLDEKNNGLTPQQRAELAEMLKR